MGHPTAEISINMRRQVSKEQNLRKHKRDPCSLQVGLIPTARSKCCVNFHWDTERVTAGKRWSGMTRTSHLSAWQRQPEHSTDATYQTHYYNLPFICFDIYKAFKMKTLSHGTSSPIKMQIGTLSKWRWKGPDWSTPRPFSAVKYICWWNRQNGYWPCDGNQCLQTCKRWGGKRRQHKCTLWKE